MIWVFFMWSIVYNDVGVCYYTIILDEEYLVWAKYLKCVSSYCLYSLILLGQAPPLFSKTCFSYFFQVRVICQAFVGRDDLARFLMYYWRTKILDVLLVMDFFLCLGNGVLVFFYEGGYYFHPYRCQLKFNQSFLADYYWC